MLDKQPNRKCNVYGSNVRFVEEERCIKIYYTLANGREEFWEIPPDTDFMPPDWFEPGCSFQAWTQNRSNSKAYTDYDWVWVAPLHQEPTTRTALTERLRAKMNLQQTQAPTNFNNLFGDN